MSCYCYTSKLVLKYIINNVEFGETTSQFIADIVMKENETFDFSGFELDFSDETDEEERDGED